MRAFSRSQAVGRQVLLPVLVGRAGGQDRRMRPLAFLWLLSLAIALAGCSGSETVTVRTERTTTLTETATVATTVQAEPAIFVPQSGGRPEYKPREIVTAVSGGGVRIDEWISYGGEIATARGSMETNDCIPNCAAGKRERFDGDVSLRGRIACKGVPAYGQMTVSYRTAANESAFEAVALSSFCSGGG
jgi:hypothetical protein